mmetsp:Transcript_33578/g.63143  ORF Transcript_33578/g.63143 Transcript_33578/m.63143 type:complete len:260 (-) Transcript_33578:98-877(-)
MSTIRHRSRFKNLLCGPYMYSRKDQRNMQLSQTSKESWAQVHDCSAQVQDDEPRWVKFLPAVNEHDTQLSDTRYVIVPHTMKHLRGSRLTRALIVQEWEKCVQKARSEFLLSLQLRGITTSSADSVYAVPRKQYCPVTARSIISTVSVNKKYGLSLFDGLMNPSYNQKKTRCRLIVTNSPDQESCQTEQSNRDLTCLETQLMNCQVPPRALKSVPKCAQASAHVPKENGNLKVIITDGSAAKKKVICYDTETLEKFCLR